MTTDLMTAGIIDDTGLLADFQTFHFGSDFSGLTRVEIPTDGWSLDNLMVSVPEPSSGALLLVGGLLWFCVARKKKNKIGHEEAQRSAARQSRNKTERDRSPVAACGEPRDRRKI